MCRYFTYLKLEFRQNAFSPERATIPKHRVQPYVLSATRIKALKERNTRTNPTHTVHHIQHGIFSKMPGIRPETFSCCGAPFDLKYNLSPHQLRLD
jgi:hypothetical protein